MCKLETQLKEYLRHRCQWSEAAAVQKSFKLDVLHASACHFSNENH